MARGTSRVGAVVAVAASLMGSGCGGETSGGGTTVPLAELGSRIAQIQCRKLYECCTPAQIMTAEMGNILIDPFTGEPGCRVAYEAFLDPATPRLQDAIDNGRATYDASEAGACLSRIDHMSCQELKSSSPQCTVFTPLQQDGEECKSDSECVSDACDNVSSDTFGTCQPRANVGQPCTESCVAGAYCDISGFCMSLKANGQTCSLSSECESTRCANGTCAPDSICPR